MPDNNIALLENNAVLQFVNQKYNNNKSVETIALTEPYYRFFRIIDLLQKQHIKVLKDDTWADLGCHHGQFLQLIGDVYGCKLVGMDDWDLKAAMPFVQFQYFAGDLADSKWADAISPGKIKFLSALEVIEHMIDTDKFLETIYNKLENGGYVIFSTPNINSLRNRIMVPLGKYPVPLEYRNIIHHVRLFNVPVIRKFLAEKKFIVSGCIGVSFLPERWLRFKLLRKLSEILANVFPSLCSNIIVVAQKNSQQ
jgi:2-polyprenyl-3-methyl-5-hydroxy-6-metoxy-1,4-benzoquinol methylase